MRRFFFTLIIIHFLGAVMARADHSGPGYREFADQFHNIDLVSSGLESRILYNYESGVLGELSNEQIMQFRQIADNQALIWADTILESEYEAAGNTRLDRVEGIYSDQHLVAYRVTYSQDAWDTSHCEFEVDVQACVPGRIVEATFVSPDLVDYLRDDRFHASFLN